MIKWTPFTFDGESYDLTHLHPVRLECKQEANKGKPERIYKFQVIFSLHCFTTKKLGDEDSRLFYRDNRECRVFCFDRYQLSKRLPEIIKDIFGRKCYHTGYSNYFTIEILNQKGVKVEYQVYFTVTKCSKVKGTLNLYIQSAYLNTKNIKAKKSKPIKFRVIAYNTQVNRAIKLPT